MYIDYSNLNDIDILRLYSEKEIDNVKKSSTPFYNVGPLFAFSNEECNAIFNEDLTNKKVLTITASGDQILHMINCGATDITSFDINIFTKYLARFKVAMIKCFGFKKFNKYMNDFKNIVEGYLYNKGDEFFVSVKTFISKKENENELNINVIKKLKKYLDDDSYNFILTFFEIITKNKMLYKDFFYMGTILSNIYSDKKIYLELKSKINDVNIKYIDSEIFELPKNINEKFDYIYLSNVPQYVKNKEELLKNYFDILNDDGKIVDVLFLDNLLTTNYGNNHDIKEKNIGYDMCLVEHTKKKN